MNSLVVATWQRNCKRNRVLICVVGLQ